MQEAVGLLDSISEFCRRALKGLQAHGQLWLLDESYVISRKRG